ncbi:MAG: aspartyl protease family protein, partial [Candidatus Zixiibacteriota bacterium]
VQIDLNNGRIIAYRPDFLASRDLNGAHELPLSFSNKIPHVPGSYSGVGGEFLIDLGSNLGLIFLREYARKTGLDTLATTGGGVTIGGVGGATTAGNVIVDEFTLGDLKLQDFPAVILGEGQGIAASREVAGNLGLVFWRDYLLTLDYPGRRALITPVN